MIFFLIISSALLGTVFGFSESQITGAKYSGVGDVSANMNEWIDEILKNIKNKLVHEGLDPMEIEDIHKEFETRLFFVIRQHGEMDLTNGWLSDHSIIERKGDVTATYSRNGKRATLVVPLTFRSLQFSYDYSAKFAGLGPEGGVRGSIANVDYVIELDFDFHEIQLSLKRFDIINTGHIYLYFTGNDLSDWLRNILWNVATTTLKSVILFGVKVEIHKELVVIVDDINGSIDKFLEKNSTISDYLSQINEKYARI